MTYTPENLIPRKAYAGLRLVAVNAKGVRLHLWANGGIDGDMVEHLTATEAFAIMDGKSTGFRYTEENGKPIRNRIHHWEIIHPNGQHEIIGR